MTLSEKVLERYLLGMISPHQEKTVAVIKSCIENLKKQGLISEANTLVAIWDTCYGGCGYSLSREESEEATKISKFCFFCPDVPPMLVRQISGRLADQVLREELRKISTDMEGSFVKYSKPDTS